MGNSDSRGSLIESFAALKCSEKPPESPEFWEELWRAKTSAEEIYELLGPTEVRELRARRPKGLAALLGEAARHLDRFVRAPDLARAGEALNCVRVLQRLLPFLLEDPADDLVFQLCWSQEPLEDSPAAGGGEGGAESEAPEEEEAGGPFREEPLAKLILTAVMRLLFLPGFTVDQRALEVRGGGEGAPGAWSPAAIWAAGLGGAAPDLVARNRSSTFNSNRVEVLRLLLTSLCEPLYRPAMADEDLCGSPWKLAASDPETPNAQLLFFSLMNTVLSYEPHSSSLPYAGHLGSAGAVAAVEKAAQVLMVLLDHIPADGNEPREGEEAAEEAPAEAPPNVYRQLLAGVRDPKDLTFIFNGLSRLLNNLIGASTTMLPSSVPRISFYQEVLVIFWKILEENDNFLQHALKKCDATQLVAPLCYLMHSVRHERHLIGIIHFCTFILLKMSSDRALAIGCSKVPYKRRLPTDLPLFTGSYCDLLLITLQQVMMSGGERMASQYNCFLTIICNISPYCKSLSLEASMKLASLFEVFTARSFLYTAEQNGAYVALLLETFCNIAQYQFEGNSRVIYALVRQRSLFENLFALTRDTAMEEAYDLAQRRHQARGLQGTAPLAFEPTVEWLEAMMPIQSQMTLQCLIKAVSAEIDSVCSSNDEVDEVKILSCIEGLTMVGLLPVPHPIVIRQYQKNPMTSLWVTCQLWVIIFMQNQVMPLFDGGKIRLFAVSAAETQARAARQAMPEEAPKEDAQATAADDEKVDAGDGIIVLDDTHGGILDADEAEAK